MAGPGEVREPANDGVQLKVDVRKSMLHLLVMISHSVVTAKVVAL